MSAWRKAGGGDAGQGRGATAESAKTTPGRWTKLNDKGRAGLKAQHEGLLRTVGPACMACVGGPTWMEGLCKWPRLEVVCRGSWPNIMVCALRAHEAGKGAPGGAGRVRSLPPALKGG
jgi:hypothetical protein